MQPGLKNAELGVMFDVIWYSITIQMAGRLALAQIKICGNLWLVGNVPQASPVPHELANTLLNK